MFAIHCNKCFRQQSHSPKLKYHVSRCNHIVCKYCLVQDNEPCPICQQTFQATQIRGGPISTLFENPLLLMKQCQQAFKFQSEQRISLFIYFYQKQLHQIHSSRKEHDSYLKIDKRLREAIDAEKLRISKLTDFISYEEARRTKSCRNDFDSFNEVQESRQSLSSMSIPTLSTSRTSGTTLSGDKVNESVANRSQTAKPTRTPNDFTL